MIDDIKLTKQKELEDLKKQHQVRTQAIKYVEKYKTIKFFEKKKTIRKINQLKRKLLEIGHEREKIVIKEELQEFEDNLLYINNYPYGYKYISLYPKDKNEVYIKKHKEMFDFIFKNIKKTQDSNKQILINEFEEQNYQPKKDGEVTLTEIDNFFVDESVMIPLNPKLNDWDPNTDAKTSLKRKKEKYSNKMSSKYSKIEKILPATVSSGANKFEKKKSNSGDSSIPLSGGLNISAKRLRMKTALSNPKDSKHIKFD